MIKSISISIISICCITFSVIGQPNTPKINKNSPVKNINVIIKHHVVIQLTSGDSLAWKGVLNNIKHLKESWGDSVQIELVAHGPGIDLLVLTKTTEQHRIFELNKLGVQFFACENTLKSKNISKNLILPQVGFVPSGVTEIVMKQEQGWSYLKAGF